MILTIVNNKGGVAKTTSARNLADVLAINDYNVLCVDMDPSGNLTQSFGMGIPEKGVGELVEGELKAKALVYQGAGYDFTIIDCPPNLGVLTTMALYACNYFIVPMEPEHFSVNGLKDLLDYSSQVTEDDRFLGAFLTRYHMKERSVLRRQMLGLAKDELKGKVFDQMIRRNVKLAEAQALGESIVDYAPDSNGARDYIALTKEILTKIN